MCDQRLVVFLNKQSGCCISCEELWDGKPRVSNQHKRVKEKRIPKDLALGHLKGLVIAFNSYHPALKLKLSGDPDNRESRGGKEPTLGKPRK